MIGGTDIVIREKGDPEALDACVRMIREYWPLARFENALTGEKYSHYITMSCRLAASVNFSFTPIYWPRERGTKAQPMRQRIQCSI
jgi:hypothetical protein